MYNVQLYIQDTHTLYTVCCVVCSDAMYALYIYSVWENYKT